MRGEFVKANCTATADPPPPHTHSWEGATTKSQHLSGFFFGRWASTVPAGRFLAVDPPPPPPTHRSTYHLEYQPVATPSMTCYPGAEKVLNMWCRATHFLNPAAFPMRISGLEADRSMPSFPCKTQGQ